MKSRISTRGKAWIGNIFLAVISFIFTALALEGACTLILQWRNHSYSTATKAPASVVRPTPVHLVHQVNLGMSRPAPGSYELLYATKSQTIYQGKSIPVGKTVPISYHIDSLSRRYTPFASIQANGKYALFLGCSFTYGEAVSDSGTLPYFFGKQTGYRPYNYGVSGHSPSHILGLLQTNNLRKEISEKDGIAFYTYIDDHVARVLPTTRWVNNSDGYLPWVNPVSLVVEGSYAQKHPIRTKLIRWMYKSNIVTLFNVNFPNQYKTEHYRHFVDIVQKSRELYQQQFGNDNFYVVIFPAYPLRPELRQLFDQAHLKLIDYSDLVTWKTAYDGMHPNSEAYRQVAEKLAEDVPVSIPIARVYNPRLTPGLVSDSLSQN